MTDKICIHIRRHMDTHRVQRLHEGTYRYAYFRAAPEDCQLLYVLFSAGKRTRPDDSEPLSIPLPRGCGVGIQVSTNHGAKTPWSDDAGLR